MEGREQIEEQTIDDLLCCCDDPKIVMDIIHEELQHICANCNSAHPELD